MLKSKFLKNRVVGTQFGQVTFDADGVALDVSVEHQEKLGELAYMEYTEEKKAPAGKAKEETLKEPEDKTPAEPAKPATKKPATRKRTTAKKETK